MIRARAIGEESLPAQFSRPESTVLEIILGSLSRVELSITSPRCFSIMVGWWGKGPWWTRVPGSPTFSRVNVPQCREAPPMNGGLCATETAQPRSQGHQPIAWKHPAEHQQGVGISATALGPHPAASGLRRLSESPKSLALLSITTSRFSHGSRWGNQDTLLLAQSSQDSSYLRPAPSGVTDNPISTPIHICT